MRFEEILIICACLGSILTTCQSKVYDPVVNVILADFNGDNKTDFLRQEKGSWDDDRENTAGLYLSNGDGTFKVVGLPEDYGIPGDLTNIYLGDFDGDGKTDFLRQEKGSWDDDQENTAGVFLSNGNGTFKMVPLPENYGIPGDLTNLYFGDFNGDGKTDFLRQEKGSWDDDKENTAGLYLSNGDGTFKIVALPESYGIPGDLTNIYLGDFNGDGMADFLRQEKGSWDDDQENTAGVFLSNGNGTFKVVPLPEESGLPGDLTNLYFGDFDGDGKTDFLRQEKGAWDDDDEYTADVFFSNGDGTFTVVALPENYGIPGDLTILHVADFSMGNGTNVIPPPAPASGDSSDAWKEFELHILAEALADLILSGAV